MSRHQEERELLAMQAEVLRLKIAAEHLKNRQPDNPLWQEARAWTEHLPVGSLMLAAVRKPKRWRHKLWGVLAVAAVAFLRQR